MCGIAGIIYREGSGPLGRDMTRMLQAMKHRGPDSTGYALYGEEPDELLVMQRGRELGYKMSDEQFDSILQNIRKENKLEDQATFEAFYRLQLLQHLALTPDVQVILHPALQPGADAVLVLGVRARFVL